KLDAEGGGYANSFKTIEEAKKQYLHIGSDTVSEYVFSYEDENESAPYFKSFLLGKQNIHKANALESIYTENLKKAEDFFEKKIHEVLGKDGVEGLKKYFDKITANLFLNVYEVEDDTDVFVVFDSLNSKGKP
ncbi:MAG: hypothetical protein OXB93_01900, partial [Cytophagales bacterium]|nr:hypothetical protein [Cytophagales bacterium]